MEGLRQEELPLAMDNWLSEIRARNGSVRLEIEDPNQGAGKLILVWDLGELRRAVLEGINEAFDLAAREWLYYAAGAYDAVVHGYVDRSSEAEFHRLRFVILQCRR